MKPEFREYQKQVIKNAQALAKYLQMEGVKVLTGGTDNHLLLLDLRDTNINGRELQERLESVKIISNKNAIPFDTASKEAPSGLRLGTPAVTSRGMGERQMFELARIIGACIKNNIEEDTIAKEMLKAEVLQLVCRFPFYF